MVRLNWGRAAFVLLFLLLGGCVDRSTGTLPPTLPPSAVEQELLDRLSSPNYPVSSVRALLNAQMSIDGRRASFRYIVVLSGSNQIRLEVLPPNAAYALFVITSRRGVGEILDVENKDFYVGEISVASLKRFIGFPIPISDLPAYLLAAIPPSQGGEKRIYPLNNSFGVTTERGEWRGEISTESGLFLNQQLRSVFDDSVILDVSYQSFRQCGSGKIPHSIRLSPGDPERFAELSIRAARCDNAIPKDLFRLQKPVGYRERSLRSGVQP